MRQARRGDAAAALRRSRRAQARAPAAAPRLVAAPMPGVILEVSVKPPATRSRAASRSPILEAMKMQNSIKSPRAGTIAEVCVGVGQAVGHGDAIVRFEEG